MRKEGYAGLACLSWMKFFFCLLYLHDYPPGWLHSATCATGKLRTAHVFSQKSRLCGGLCHVIQIVLGKAWTGINEAHCRNV